MRIRAGVDFGTAITATERDADYAFIDGIDAFPRICREERLTETPNEVYCKVNDDAEQTLAASFPGIFVSVRSEKTQQRNPPGADR